jgi:hypothetical protein
MFLVINGSGQVWDGHGWSEKGREFCTIARATRSLHEEGEDLDNALIVSADLLKGDST